MKVGKFVNITFECKFLYATNTVSDVSLYKIDSSLYISANTGHFVVTIFNGNNVSANKTDIGFIYAQQIRFPSEEGHVLSFTTVINESIIRGFGYFISTS